MRRRSERKKSVEASPVASSRRSSRRTRRTSDIEKNDEPEQHHDETPTKTDSSPNRASSEERVESTRRGKATRNSRTPAKRILRKLSGTDKQIDCIEEEENGVAHQVEQKIVEEEEVVVESTTTVVNEQEVQSNHESSEQVEVKRATDDAGEVNEITSNVEQREPLTVQADDNEATGEEKDVGVDDTSACEPKLNFSNEDQNITEVLMTGTKTNQVEVDKKDVEKEAMPTIDETETHEDKMEKETESENLEKSHPQEHAEDKKEEIPIDEESDKLKNVDAKDHFPNEEKSNGPQEIEVDVKKPNSVKPTEEAQLNNNNDSKVSAELPRSRKRKWLSKKPTDGKDQIMAISTDSLKNLIADVQPVPLSDVQLESSSEVEEVASERDDIVRDSNSNSPTDSEPRRNIIEPKVADKLNKSADNAVAVCQSVPKAVMPVLHNSPSPPRNNTSNVLYITNLVRPFTIMQLKGLLARTGKIVENGFWIDRIKSKCYVQYETEDEAIETRHALHGVRWPVSNPKCLNVDFGNYVDMERAIKTTADDGPKYGQDFKENFNAGTGWNREPQETQEDKKNSKPIREWDVGKKESREKREMEKREQRSPKEAEEDKFKKNRGRQRAGRSSSLSPARKVKKEEPPLRLLDDLFRKTKAAPCIYWLPLTPEQIAGKEAFRQKRIEERQERIKLRELQREKEHELDRGRDRDRSRERVKSRDRERSRERDRDRRRNRSNERRRSRSRDRRRY